MARKRQTGQAKRKVKKNRPNRRGKALARRIEKIRQFAGRLWKPKQILISLLVLALIYGVVKIESDNMIDKIWPIKSVRIEGEFKYLDKQALQQQTLPVVKGGFFSVDLEAIRNALVFLPWVEDVSVRRQWPGTLLVRVIEKQPVVYWGKDAMISAKGSLFKPKNKPQIDLPKLNGPEKQYKMMLTELARMQAWLLETGLYIQAMKLDARRSWTLRMTTGLELRLGRKQLHERLQRFVSVYKTNLQAEKREIKHIDMRYTNGFAVAWKEA